MPRKDWMFHERVERLADYLAAEGALTSPEWREVLHEVPRDLFVPERAYAASYLPDAASRVIDASTDRSGWLDAIYRNFSIITQRDDGAAEATDTSAGSTSSLSCPHIAMTYLELLELAPHHRVLEIGTGTGWTAAMIARRVGARKITTIEVDKALAEQARANLKAAGVEPEVITADGAKGHPDRAPYDRIHVTCGVTDIPQAWIEQTRPGGMIVVPYMPLPGAYGHQLVLDVIDEHTAFGRFHGGGGFTLMRDQRPEEPEVKGTAKLSATRLDPRLIAQADGGAQLLITALVPGLILMGAGWEKVGGQWRYEVRLADVLEDSVAVCSAAKGADEYEVKQWGRPLWDQAEAAYLEWLRLGRPGRDRFGFKLSDGWSNLWLDSPTNLLNE